jgi:hypothetical protein
MSRELRKAKYVWPDLVVMEFLTAVALTVILIIWALLINAPLLEVANPGISENPSKAPWYFVGLQELLVYFDPWIAGVIIPGIVVIALIIIPYIDTNPKGADEYSFSLRRFAVINFIFGFSMWLILIFTGYFLRGPNWQFYMPWESWETVKYAEEHLWNLNPYAGFICIIAYFAFGITASLLLKKELYKKTGLIRYAAIISLILMMYAVPLKILLRLAFNIRYILVTPWFNI